MSAVRAQIAVRIAFQFAAILLLSAHALPASTQQTPSRHEVGPDLPDLPDTPQAQAPVQQPPIPIAQRQIAEPAQSPTPPAPACIHGTVTDREGATYEGVRITLTQPPPSSEIIVTTDSNGSFLLTGIPAGPFQLSVDANGFTTQKIEGVLHPGDNFQVPTVTLLLSASVSEVSVTASRFEIAQEELHAEEQQRVFGIIPNFYVVYAPNAPSLTAKQKFHLAWRTAIDPFTFIGTGIAAGIQQANNTFSGYGQGSQGYAKRYGANYADGFIGNMLGGAVFPSIFKQDPRYFYKGTGTVRSRILYAIANAVLCRGDNGHKQFDYSGILGGLAAAGISNLYYPASDRNGAGLTFENTGLSIGYAAIGNLFQEFLVRKLTPKLPNYNQSKP